MQAKEDSEGDCAPAAACLGGTPRQSSTPAAATVSTLRARLASLHDSARALAASLSVRHLASCDLILTPYTALSDDVHNADTPFSLAADAAALGAAADAVFGAVSSEAQEPCGSSTSGGGGGGGSLEEDEGDVLLASFASSSPRDAFLDTRFMQLVLGDERWCAAPSDAERRGGYAGQNAAHRRRVAPPLAISSGGRSLRAAKRHRVLTSPLLHVQYARVCLDEAQKVGCGAG
jgi:hypothetical protein